MKIVYNGKTEKIDINSLPMIGEGIEGTVYNFNGKALKLYKPSRYDYLQTPTKEKIEYLSKIKLHHFPFPEVPVFKDDELIGHIAPLITGDISIGSLLDLPIPQLICRLKSIRDDINELSEKTVLLSECDFYRNFIYNGDFYFIDHDLYEVYLNQLDDIKFKKMIKKQNDFIINDFYVINFILRKLYKKPQLMYRKKLVSKGFILQNHLDELTFEEFLNELFIKDGIPTIHKYVKVYRKDILKI